MWGCKLLLHPFSSASIQLLQPPGVGQRCLAGADWHSIEHETDCTEPGRRHCQHPHPTADWQLSSRTISQKLSTLPVQRLIRSVTNHLVKIIHESSYCHRVKCLVGIKLAICAEVSIICMIHSSSQKPAKRWLGILLSLCVQGMIDERGRGYQYQPSNIKASKFRESSQQWDFDDRAGGHCYS